MTSRRTTVLALIAGALVGAVTAGIVAVNLVIFAGPDEGYESSLGDVFEHSPLLGVVTVAVLIAGPVVGVLVARRIRRQQVR